MVYLNEINFVSVKYLLESVKYSFEPISKTKFASFKVLKQTFF